MDAILKKLNVKPPEVKLQISPDDIPTLLPKAVLKEWQQGDDDPYYKIEMLEYPVEGNGGTYQESFFESFINKTKKRPIPGSRAGHEPSWGKRGPTDLIVVGGLVEKNGDGTGKVYLKNYIPPIGDTGDNGIFIRENKSDMIHFSLVSYVRVDRVETPNGYESKIVESMYGERNDAVEYGTGAMEQITNSSTEEEKNILGVAEKKNAGGLMEPTKKEEVLKTLLVLKENAEVTLPEVAEAMGLKNKLITEEHSNALVLVNSLKEKLGDGDILEKIEVMQKNITDNLDVVRNARLDILFGSNADEKNELRFYMGKETNGLSGEAFENKIEKVKTEDPIAMRLLAENADYTSDVNKQKVGKVEKNKDKDERPSEGSRRVDEI